MLKFIFTVYFFSGALFAKTQTVDFTYQSSNNLYCIPATVQFAQNCTGNPIGYVWDFGNNTEGYTSNPSATYTKAGSYTVKLIAIYSQATLEISKIIVVHPAITPLVGYDKNYICQPGNINFSASSNGNIVDYAWDFGDNSGTVNAATPDAAHTYASYNTFTVALKATDEFGCAGQAKTTVKVAKPTIQATSTPASGCIPANVSFAANVTVPLNDKVIDYSWNFGDNSPVVSTTVRNISHPYTITGSYSPSVSITTSDGCTNTYNFPAIQYGTPPTSNITYPKKTVVCGSEIPVFVSKATNANRYDWNFGDNIKVSVTDTFTQHKYATLGFKTVTVTPFFNGCAGKTDTVKIEVIGVIAKYIYSNTCASKKTYFFTDMSQGTVSSSVWKFGDNSPDASTINAVHGFPDSGQFSTSLKVTDAGTGCSDTYAQIIYTANPALVNADSAICKNASTSFYIASSYPSGSATYTWNIGGVKIGPSTTPSVTVKAATLGYLNNSNTFVSIKYGVQSCPDTVKLTRAVLVRGPNLIFNAPTPICFNTLFTLKDSSKPFIATDSVTLWYWNYGNSNVNDTIFQPVPFLYKAPGAYNVKLVAIDVNGCKDSLAKAVRVNPLPFLLVVPHTDTLCQGQAAALVAFSNSNILWSPTDSLSCVNCDSLVAKPAVTTKYFVTATTAAKCTLQDSVLISVYTPFTAISPINNFYVCPNDEVQLDVGPKKYAVTWQPASNLSGSTIYSPVVSPLQNITYTATLTDSVGCFSSSTAINIFVKSLPTVNAGPDKTLPYNSVYTISPAYSGNVSAYSWSPTALLSCNDCASPVATAQYTETYTIKVTSDSGCIASDTVNIYVECKNANILLPKAFTPNNDNLNDYYYPITRGIKTILKFIIYNRQGKVMFKAENFAPNNKASGWDGSFKGSVQPVGGYVYTLEVLCELGEKLTKTDSFLLLQ